MPSNEEALQAVLERIAVALEKQVEVNKHHLQYAIDRDRVTFEFMERREKREIDTTKTNIILGDDR